MRLWQTLRMAGQLVDKAIGEAIGCAKESMCIERVSLSIIEIVFDNDSIK
ncbi:hypothetical protein [Galliscardovia ingluviei]|nr:hypothetical protein [Galliscardovia ingluviei]